MGPAERAGLAWEGAQGAEGALTERGPWAGGGVWRLQWNVASRRFRTERRAGRASEAAVAWRQDPDPTAGPAGTVGAAPSGVCLCRAGPRAGTGHPVSKHQAGRAVRHGPRRFVPAPRLSRGPGGARGRVGPAGQRQPVPRWRGGPCRSARPRGRGQARLAAQSPGVLPAPGARALASALGPGPARGSERCLLGRAGSQSPTAAALLSEAASGGRALAGSPGGMAGGARRPRGGGRGLLAVGPLAPRPSLPHAVLHCVQMGSHTRPGDVEGGRVPGQGLLPCCC